MVRRAPDVLLPYAAVQPLQHSLLTSTLLLYDKMDHSHMDHGHMDHDMPGMDHGHKCNMNVQFPHSAQAA